MRINLAALQLGMRSVHFTRQDVRLYRVEPHGTIYAEVDHFFAGSVIPDRSDVGPLYKVAGTLRRTYENVVQEIDSELGRVHPAIRGEVMADLVQAEVTC